jgi:hypothetical protein
MSPSDDLSILLPSPVYRSVRPSVRHLSSRAFAFTRPSSSLWSLRAAAACQADDGMDTLQTVFCELSANGVHPRLGPCHRPSAWRRIACFDRGVPGLGSYCRPPRPRFGLSGCCHRQCRWQRRLPVAASPAGKQLSTSGVPCRAAPASAAAAAAAAVLLLG